MRFPGHLDKIVEPDPDYAGLVIGMTEGEAATNHRERAVSIGLGIACLAICALAETVSGPDLSLLLPAAALLAAVAAEYAAKVHRRTGDRTILLVMVGVVAAILYTQVSVSGAGLDGMLLGCLGFVFGTFIGVSSRRQENALAGERKRRKAALTGKHP